MSFKLNPKPPWYNKESKGVSINKIKMEDGVLGKANRDGTIDINKDIKDPNKINQVVSHEKVHLDQMERGDLDYDDNNVIWKGKKYSRSKMDEGNKNLPWEKEAYAKMNKMEKFKLKGHRGNSTPFNNITQRGLVTPLNLEEGSDEDPVTTKTKTKTNRKGEVITKEITKNSETGRKTKSINTKGPVTTTTTPAPPPTKIEVNTPESSVEFPAQPKQTITPGSSTEGDNKPFVKPLKITGYKEAYNKTDKSIPFEEFETKAIKWNKENPGKKTPSKLDHIPARPARIVNPGVSHSLMIPGVPTTSTSTYETNETKTKIKNNQNNNQKNKAPKSKKEEYCTPESTSVSCLGTGKSGPFGLKTKKGGVTSEAGKNLAKSERKARDKKIFAPLAAAKESIALGSAGRKQKRGRASAQRKMKIQRFFSA